MGLFDDYFEPQQYQPGRGLTGWLESLQQQQDYQPAGGFGSWPQAGAMPNRSMETPAAPQPVQPQSAFPTPVVSPTPYPAGNVPIPVSRPADLPSRGIAIGDYFMPQVGETQAAPAFQAQPDLGDRLGAGFKSWAYTPVGNPFAALANAITGFTSGQFAASPALTPADPRLRSAAQSQGDDGTGWPSNPVAGMPLIARTPARRGFVPRR